MTPDEWALDFYDRYVARQGGPVAQEKIRDAMGVAYSDAVDTGVIAPEVVTPYEAGRRLYERHIKPELKPIIARFRHGETQEKRVTLDGPQLTPEENQALV